MTLRFASFCEQNIRLFKLAANSRSLTFCQLEESDILFAERSNTAKAEKPDYGTFQLIDTFGVAQILKFSSSIYIVGGIRVSGATKVSSGFGRTVVR